MMSNDYVVKMLVDQRLADLRGEAAGERLAHELQQGRPRPRRWWERLMLPWTGQPRGHRSVTLGSVRG